MNKKNNNFKNIIFKRIILTLSFFLILSLFCFIYSFFVKNNDYDEKIIRTITYIIGLLIFFIYGIITGLAYKKNGLVEGLISSSLIILIALIFNLFGSDVFTLTNIIKIISYLVITAVGSIIGVNIYIKKKQ